MGKISRAINNNPGATLVVVNTGLVACFFMMVGIYKAAREEKMLDTVDFLKAIVKPF